ncbi:MAG: hypothetical protein ACQESP_09335 [Candidatus Muiribacteriota bacterium]
MLEERNEIVEFINGYEKIKSVKIIDFKIVNMDGDLYSYAVELDKFKNSYLVFDRKLENLLQWPNMIAGGEENTYKDENIVVLGDFLFNKIPSERQDFPLEKTTYISEFVGVTEGIDFNKLNLNKITTFFKLENTSEIRKNQRESREAINYLNTLHNTDKFIYSGEPENPPYKCYFFAGANVIDWKRAQAGIELDDFKYKNFLNHNIESGTDPRFLELMYRELSYLDKDKFKIMSPFFLKDPVTKESVIYSIKGLPESIKNFDLLPETILDQTLTLKKYKKSNFQYLKNISPLNLKKRDKNIKIEQIIEYLNKYGALLGGIGLRNMGAELDASAHAVTIVGGFKIKDYDFLIYLDNYGEDVPYKFLPVTYFDYIYGFSTPLKYKKEKNKDYFEIKFYFEEGAKICVENFDSEEIYGIGNNNNYFFPVRQNDYKVNFSKKFFYPPDQNKFSITVRGENYE